MRKRIGDLFVDKGIINHGQVDQILKYSAQTGLRFGESALELGLVTRDQMVEIFGPSFAVDFFHLQPEYYPAQTRDALDIKTILKWGVLPLGFKMERKFFTAKRILNLGSLDPARAGLREACKAACAEADGVRPYLVLGDQFVAILQTVYGFTREKLAAHKDGDIDPTLRMFL